MTSGSMGHSPLVRQQVGSVRHYLIGVFKEGIAGRLVVAYYIQLHRACPSQLPPSFVGCGGYKWVSGLVSLVWPTVILCSGPAGSYQGSPKQVHTPDGVGGPPPPTWQQWSLLGSCDSHVWKPGSRDGRVLSVASCDRWVGLLLLS